MLSFPDCKLNIGLYVTRRRADGYHDIETVFYPVPINDALEIVPATETRLHISGLTVSGNNEQNLVHKAYELLKRNKPGKVTCLDIYLCKAIPIGAGLGGGSADGAFMLRLLNDYFQLGYSSGQLAAFALQLGSDCPFFIYDTPKFATGRGEDMTDVTVNLSSYSIQVICPQVHVATVAAFQLITPKPAPFDLREIGSLPVEEWKNEIGNDFEQPVFSQHPALADIKQQLYMQDAVYAAMSGSGSSVYGIFVKDKKAAISCNIPFREFYIK